MRRGMATTARPADPGSVAGVTVVVNPRDGLGRLTDTSAVLDRSRPRGLQDAVAPLLGYDWIAGLLDNRSLDETGDVDLEDLALFRRQHYHECHAPLDPSLSLQGWPDGAPAGGPGSDEQQHPRSGASTAAQRGYRVNARLYPEPLPSPEERSVARVLGQDLLSFVRVSIPRRQSAAADEVATKPPTKETFDPRGSVALRDHCVQGYESVAPHLQVVREPFDLASSLRAEEPRLARWPTGVAPPLLLEDL
jgi:hypothetical protein